MGSYLKRNVTRLLVKTQIEASPRLHRPSFRSWKRACARQGVRGGKVPAAARTISGADGPELIKVRDTVTLPPTRPPCHLSASLTTHRPTAAPFEESDGRQPFALPQHYDLVVGAFGECAVDRRTRLHSANAPEVVDVRHLASVSSYGVLRRGSFSMRQGLRLLLNASSKKSIGITAQESWAVTAIGEPIRPAGALLHTCRCASLLDKKRYDDTQLQNTRIEEIITGVSL